LVTGNESDYAPSDEEDDGESDRDVNSDDEARQVVVVLESRKLSSYVNMPDQNEWNLC
jgi:hypothetical protein